jgi:hypothetical protein
MKTSSRNPLSKLDECDEEDEEEDEDDAYTTGEDAYTLTSQLPQKISSMSKLSSSMKGLGFVGKSKSYHTGAPKGKVGKTNYRGKASEHQSGSRSANELLPPSAREWSAFLNMFQELLPSAFRARKHTAGGGPRQMPRLGTSCQF